VHRDVKPANVMVGRYGEVMLMDWGISKPLSSKRDPAATAAGVVAAAKDDPPGDDKKRLFATRLGSLVGTPAYMSPEQARGENDRLDARCDLYSASVLFHELINLKHYLHGTETMDAVLAEVSHGEDPGFLHLLFWHHPDHRPAPGELVHVAQKGLAKDPARRYQSAREMIDMLQRVLEGKVSVQCHITLMKRGTRELGRFVDARPMLAFAILVASVLGLLAGLVTAVVRLLH
jgi:serine/threonine-protein kinase